MTLKMEDELFPEELSPTNINEEKRESGSAILKQLLSQRDDDEDFEKQRQAIINRSVEEQKAKQEITSKGDSSQLFVTKLARVGFPEPPSILVTNLQRLKISLTAGWGFYFPNLDGLLLYI